MVDVISIIQDLTGQVQALQGPAEKLTQDDGSLVPMGQGRLPSIVAGLMNVVSSAQAGMPQKTSQVAAGTQADAVFEAYKSYVETYRTFLQTLIDKSQLFASMPLVGQAVAASLGQVEGATDTLSQTLVDCVESRATDLQTYAQQASSKMDIALQTYQSL